MASEVSKFVPTAETIADICAEMRNASGCVIPGIVTFNEDGGIDFSVLADRIEAAKEREFLTMFIPPNTDYSDRPFINRITNEQIRNILNDAGRDL